MREHKTKYKLIFNIALISVFVYLSVFFASSIAHAQQVRQKLTDDRGEAIFEKVILGDYSVRVEMNGEVKEKNVTVESNDETKEVVVTLDQEIRKSLLEKLRDLLLSPGFLVFSLTLAALPTFINTAINYASAFKFINLLRLPYFLAGLIKKKKHPWGVVYDSKTKQPLDPAIVTLTDKDGKEYQAMTDLYGRYEFFVDPGVYTFRVEKSDYAFPSKVISDPGKERIYDNVLNSTQLIVETDQTVSYNVPMDALTDNWNQQEKIKMGITGPNKYFIPLANFMFQAGFLLSMISVLLSATRENASLFTTYLTILLVRLIKIYKKSWGTVKDSSNEILPGVVVNLINPKHPQLAGGKSVTDFRGRYNFLVEKGTHQVVINQVDETGTKEVYSSKEIEIKDKVGRVGIDIKLYKKPIQKLS